MKSSVAIFLGHIVGVVILLFVGLFLNDAITGKYAGVITVFSIAIGIYTFALNFLYRSNATFHFFVNRWMLFFRKTHTNWKPLFTLSKANIAQESKEQLKLIWIEFQKGIHGKAVKADETSNSVEIVLDDNIRLIIRILQDDSGGCLTMGFSQEILVPSHLYGEYIERLRLMLESIVNIVKPDRSAIKCYSALEF